jgi:hypothetical protein
MALLEQLPGMHADNDRNPFGWVCADEGLHLLAATVP